MIKKTVILLLTLLMMVTLFASCTAKKTTTSFVDYKSFEGKRIGVITGSVHEKVTEEDLKATSVYYSETSAIIEDIRKGRIDGFTTDMSSGRILVNSPGNEDLTYLEIPEEIFSAVSGIFGTNQDMIDRFNVFLAEIKADGTLDDIYKRWLYTVPDLDAPMPDIPLTGENGTIKAATFTGDIPFTYAGNDGELKGFCIELSRRFAAHEGMDIEFIGMEFGALIPYVVSGKADIGVANTFITEERKKSVSFTDSIFTDTLCIILLKTNAAEAEAGDKEITYTDFDGKTLGHKTGSIWDQILPDAIGAEMAYYTEMSAAVEDIRKGRLDGFVTDLSAVRAFVGTKGNEDLMCVPISAEIFTAPMGAVSLNQDIVDRFNVFLAEISADGTMDEMRNRWLENTPDVDSPMPDIPLTGENGILKVATTAGALPFAYMGTDSELKGYSIELALRFAAREGLTVEFAEMEFGGMIPYVVSGKADMAIADISITEERKKSVLFTDSIYDDQGGIVTLKQNSAATHYSAFSGKTFAVMMGSVFDEIADRIFNASDKLYFNNVIDEIQAVHLGKVDVTLLDHVVAMVNLSGGQYEDLTITEVPLEELSFRYSVFSDKQPVIDQYNEFLKTIKQDRTYDDMINRWFTDYDPARQIPEIPLTNKNGTLKIAINASYPPFVYLGKNGQWSGFDIEQFYRFAAFLEMDIELIDMEFSAMLPYVKSGKADIASSIYYTEERAQSVIFGDEDYSGKTVLIHKKSMADENVSKKGFVEWVKAGIENNLITDNRWKMIANGLGVTLIISFAAQLFGTLFGSFVCFVLTRKNRFVQWIGHFYCGLIHGTPIVVLLMITYYIIFGNSDISSVLVAIAAFTMVTGAGIAQNLQGAIDTVDPVEIEAARSIGFSAIGAFLTVTLPQAVRRVLPSYTNGFVELVKATAIVGYIAIQDLTRAGDIIRSRTYDAYFPLLFVALIYLTVTTVCVQLFKFIIKRINGGVAQ